MAPRDNPPDAPLRSSVTGRKALVLTAGAVLLAGALAVPFVYETQTLWYKSGANRVMLLAGQLAGLLALVLLLGQILLAIRARLFERLFGGATLIRWHRINGVLVACAACGHVLLVLAPEGFDNLPIGKKYWPEMVGGLLFLLLLTTVVTSHFRTWFRLDYALWRRLHRPVGYLTLVLVLVHVLFVSESFTRTVPRVALLTVGSGVLLLAGLSLLRRRSKR